MEPKQPSLSVVVVAYNIAREAKRTLYALCAVHQQLIEPNDYEVIVVDNGSEVPLDAEWIASLPGNFRLIRIDDALPSPAHAVNAGIAESTGEVIGVMIDGARIATPGLLHFALQGSRLHAKAVVATLGWYVGHDFQGRTEHPESERVREDALLESIAWPSDGYRLFEIGTMDESSVDGWLQPIAESNALFMRRELWEALGGMDEQFDAPGGGFVNLDTFSRALELPDTDLVILLGEATFHQWHGGINTNASTARQIDHWVQWSEQYTALRGRAYELPRRRRRPTYVGTLAQPTLTRFVRAALQPATRGFEPPFGASFNSTLWTAHIPPPSLDETTAHLVDLARSEFANGRFEGCCAVARFIRARTPDEPAIRDLLALVAPSVSTDGPAEDRRVEYHVALGHAHRTVGDLESAETHYREALALDRDFADVHWALSEMRMPGDDYLAMLKLIYRALSPETAVEIGVSEGKSLALFQPPTIAIGVDPTTRLVFPITTETHLFAETSDEFFARQRYENLLPGRPLSVGFIDGLHLFEQALKDFIGLEKLCDSQSVLLVHDTVPLDEPTQRRTCDTVFHTGDVWKVVLALRSFRPELDIFTIATPPSGLTVIAGLDSTSRILELNYEDVVARFMDTPYEAIASDRAGALNIVPNDWAFVQSRLAARGII